MEGPSADGAAFCESLPHEPDAECAANGGVCCAIQLLSNGRRVSSAHRATHSLYRRSDSLYRYSSWLLASLNARSSFANGETFIVSAVSGLPSTLPGNAPSDSRASQHTKPVVSAAKADRPTIRSVGPPRSTLCPSNREGYACDAQRHHDPTYDSDARSSGKCIPDNRAVDRDARAA